MAKAKVKKKKDKTIRNLFIIERTAQPQKIIYDIILKMLPIINNQREIIV